MNQPQDGLHGSCLLRDEFPIGVYSLLALVFDGQMQMNKIVRVFSTEHSGIPSVAYCLALLHKNGTAKREVLNDLVGPAV